MHNPILSQKVLYLISITYAVPINELNEAFEKLDSFDVIIKAAMEASRANRQFKQTLEDIVNGKR